MESSNISRLALKIDCFALYLTILAILERIGPENYFWFPDSL